MHEFEKHNDLYILNSAWHIFTSITPGAGGNVIAATHFGRGIAAVSVMCGVIVACLTTAALIHLLEFSSSEQTAMIIMEREKARLILKTFAANMIKLWWRRCRRPRNITKRQLKVGMHGYRCEFVAAQQMVRVEVGQCASASKKIEQISSKTRHIANCIDQVGVNLFSQKLLGGKKSPR